MRYRIDAWLERVDPEVRVLDNRSGTVLLSWGAEQLRWLIEQGELEYEELLEASDGVDHQLANRLLSLESRNVMAVDRFVRYRRPATSHYFSEYPCCSGRLLQAGSNE